MPEVMFAGPDGRLEGRYHHSKETGAPVALILHPHPLHGGTMNNRITYTMYQAFQRLGCSVMRFNFRGVGRSQGRYDGGLNGKPLEAKPKCFPLERTGDVLTGSGYEAPTGPDASVLATGGDEGLHLVSG